MPSGEDMVALRRADGVYVQGDSALPWPPYRDGSMRDRPPSYGTMLPPPNDDLPLPPIAPLAEPPTVPAPPPDEDRAALIEAIRVLSRDSAIMTETLRHAQARGGELLERCRAAECEADHCKKTRAIVDDQAFTFMTQRDNARASRDRWRKQARADMVELRRVGAILREQAEEITQRAESEASLVDMLNQENEAKDRAESEAKRLAVAARDWEDVAIGREKERARYAAQLHNLTEAIGVDPGGELATERAIDAAKDLRSVAARQRAAQGDNELAKRSAARKVSQR